ncbi:hypothetical protein CEUSTIGMA_g11707.t1 [Chlamydomonas eustigma]|uniref:Amidase domain-containing protein n=1 Tax=Chlamydomonas eustigma TaxID=1157962 RepID=A0A250XMG4_9CHLO|nr:hypothetical protein CEUSTIGMA_g11707.t1 [Chlamydomonas eustigma]|eukprot:GAX84285.1 hypothetical protein CEUSTIGMA_g11707.t1 [Chlamydomonas eustigma]
MIAPMRVKILPSADEAIPEYDLRLMRSPVLTGFALRTFISMLEGPGGSWIYPIIAWQSGLTQVLHGTVCPEAPSFLPDLPVEDTCFEPYCQPIPKYQTEEEALKSIQEEGFLNKFEEEALLKRPWRATIREYLQAYRSGKATTPSMALSRLVSFIKTSEAQQPHPCSWLVSWSEEDIMRQADESSKRYKEGTARPLDGVPFAVKDVADALPYETTAGTSFMAERRVVKESAPYVLALQRMGAILIGKANMHEIGLGVTGLNLKTGTPLNPANPRHHTGGSSSGSAALVAAGVCPIAIGTDGGGSIRIPSSFCGCVGLKPTHGRMTGAGGVEVDCTVATYGPIAGCVEDCALFYAILANQNVSTTISGEQLPPPQLPHPLTRPQRSIALASSHDQQLPASDPLPLKDIKIGVFWEWFNDCDTDVLTACRSALDTAVSMGATLVPIAIPELELMRVAHTVTIVSEMHHCMQAVWDDPVKRASFNSDVRLSLAAVKYWTPADYITAQRIRTRSIIHFKKALRTVHVIATPTTPCTAPAISEAAVRGGQSDLSGISKIMRYAVQANFVGLPAISVPVGHDTKGLPIGLQFMSKPWSEATLLLMAACLESAIWQDLKEPSIWINPLTGQQAGL